MKTRNSFLIAFVFSVGLLGISGCGALPFFSEPTPTPIARVPGVTTLWPDTPPFPGAIPDLETNAFFNGQGQASGAIQYYTDKQPSAVADFYTYELMHAQGWEIAQVKQVKVFSQGGHGGDQGDQVGTLAGCWSDVQNDKPIASCWFNKTDESGHDIELSITAETDRKDPSRFVVTYNRMTGSLVATPTP